MVYNVPSVAVRSFFRMSMLLILLGAVAAVCVQAQQAPANQTVTTVITCVSKQGERQVCKADTAAGVALLRSTGDSDLPARKELGL